MLTIQNLVCGYSAAICSYDSRYEFEAGLLYAIVGENGSGKSTFLRTLAGLIPKIQGEINIGNSEIESLKPRSRAQQVCYCSTTRSRIPFMTVEEYIYLGGGIGKSNNQAEVKQAAESCSVLHLLNFEIQNLSDGQYRKVKLAKAVYQNSPCLLVDEPTSHLDPPSRKQVVRLLRAIAKEQNKIVIMATHEIDLALDFADRVFVVHEGQIHSYHSHQSELQQRIHEAFSEV